MLTHSTFTLEIYNIYGSTVVTLLYTRILILSDNANTYQFSLGQFIILYTDELWFFTIYSTLLIVTNTVNNLHFPLRRFLTFYTDQHTLKLWFCRTHVHFSIFNETITLQLGLSFTYLNTHITLLRLAIEIKEVPGLHQHLSSLDPISNEKSARTANVLFQKVLPSRSRVTFTVLPHSVSRNAYLYDKLNRQMNKIIYKTPRNSRSPLWLSGPRCDVPTLSTGCL